MSAEASSSSAPPIPPSPSQLPSSVSPTLPSTSSSQTHPSPPLPSPETARQIAEARAALEASMTNIGNTHFASLQSRAQNLHSNTAILDKQQKDVVKATEGLRKESEKLRRWADEGQRMVKELGNVQNWAEMLERDFLLLGETVRLANGGRWEGEGSESGSQWETEGSESESESGDEGERERVEIEKKEADGEGKVVDKEPTEREEMKVDTVVDRESEVREEMRVDVEGDTEMGGTDDVDRHKDKGKGKAVDVEPQTTGTEQHQHSDEVGGSSTATGSDPSSSSVHTGASATS